MSGKNKNNATKKTEVDIEKLDRYESGRDDDELKKFQIIKSTLFFLGAALLLIVQFLPSDTSFHGSHKGFVGTFAVFNIITLAVMLDLMFQDNRRYKIRKTVVKKQAPKYGFDYPFTYLLIEIFCALMLLMLAEQCVIVAFARDGFAIAGLCLIILSVGCIFASRFILVKANKGQMTLIEVESDAVADSDSAPDSSVEDTDTQNKSVEDTEDVDDFYKSVEDTEDTAPPEE